MRGSVKVIAVATLLVASPGLDTGSARAELPEMGECLADAEQVVSTTSRPGQALLAVALRSCGLACRMIGAGPTTR